MDNIDHNIPECSVCCLGEEGRGHVVFLLLYFASIMNNEIIEKKIRVFENSACSAFSASQSSGKLIGYLNNGHVERNLNLNSF